MELKIHKTYYDILAEINKAGSKHSPYTPFPNSNIMFMCIQGWIERTERYGSTVVLTPAGRHMYDYGVVHS